MSKKTKKTMSDLRSFEGKLPKAVREFLKHNRILDARIIRGTCPTCGGSKTVPGRGLHCPVCGWVISTEGLAGVPEHCPRCQNAVLDKCEMARDCPDCADTPVWVIEPAAWEAYSEEVEGFFGVAGGWSEKEIEDIKLRILQAILPSARVAEEVVTLQEATAGGIYCRDEGLYHGPKHVVAILATQAREEVEDAEDTETPAG